MLNKTYKDQLRSAIEGKDFRAYNEDDVLSFTPSMVDSDVVVDREASSSARSVASALTEPSLEAEPNVSNQTIDAEERKETERTDTGSLLQAGSIAAGIAGIALMMAFGGGGGGGGGDSSSSNEKKNGKE